MGKTIGGQRGPKLTFLTKDNCNAQAFASFRRRSHRRIDARFQYRQPNKRLAHTCKAAVGVEAEVVRAHGGFSGGCCAFWFSAWDVKRALPFGAKDADPGALYNTYSSGIGTDVWLFDVLEKNGKTPTPSALIPWDRLQSVTVTVDGGSLAGPAR